MQEDILRPFKKSEKCHCGITKNVWETFFVRSSALNLSQAKLASKQLNLKSLAPGSPKTHRLWGGVQTGLKFSGCPRGPQRCIIFGVGRRQIHTF